jgi:putative transposase
MANTFTQIHIQFVFAVKYRQCLIQSTWKNELYKYITGIVQKQNHKLLAINGVSDHIHILIGVRPTQSISELMQDVKGSSSKWINEKKITPRKFEWQEGYGAFSYSLSQVKQVISYINNQEIHHAKKSLREEYIGFLQKFEVDFDERYIFTAPLE